MDEALGQDTPGFAEMRRLEYSRCALQETLRLYPPAFWLPRTAVEEDELDGYRIPAGTMVAVLTQVIHRHPDLWEEPLRFDPDRFSPERSKGRHRLAWLPFGAGQRQCIGKEFSLMEGQLIFARIAQRYQVSPVEGRRTRLHISTTLGPRRAAEGPPELCARPVQRPRSPLGVHACPGRAPSRCAAGTWASWLS